MAQRSAMVQSVARETGIDVRTLEETHERRIAAGEVGAGGWHPPPDDPYSRMRGTAGAGGGSAPPFGEEPQPIPPPSPKPRQGPGSASVRSPSCPIFQFGGSSGSGDVPGAGRRIKTPPRMPEGLPEALGSQGPPPGPGPSGAAQVAAVAARNKFGEVGREAKEASRRHP